MEPNVRLLERVMYPVASFIDIVPAKQEPSSDASWETTRLNPKNRILSLEPLLNPTWRMDGAQADGHRLFITPLWAIGKSPMRIDIYLSDQDDYGLPGHLRELLQFRKAVLVKGSQAARLAISQHVLRALEHWSSEMPNFENMYGTLPFGSYIVIDVINADIRKMDIKIVPRYNTEQHWITVRKFLEEAQIGQELLPPVIDIEEIQLISQPHEAISIVRIPGRHGSETYAFKSILSEVEYLYHELKTLLEMQPHPNIIPRPLYVVTKRARFGGRPGICGFILHNYTKGTLRDALWRGRASKGQDLHLQCRWAREITSAVLHIQEKCSNYYTGFKHVNVMMLEKDDGLHTILIDFDQRTARPPWAPPEICYVEYLDLLARLPALPAQLKERYARLLQEYIPDWDINSKQGHYRAQKYGYSGPWRALSVDEREYAQVYMLGYLLWYVFEGVGSTNTGLNLEAFREEPCDQVFPEYRQSSPIVRDLIRRCTSGAPELRGRFPGVVKKGDLLWPRGMTGTNGEPRGTGEDTQRAAKRWWEEEVNDAEQFLAARVRQKLRNTSVMRDRATLAVMSGRPRLREVLKCIKAVESGADQYNFP